MQKWISCNLRKMHLGILFPITGTQGPGWRSMQYDNMPWHVAAIPEAFMLLPLYMVPDYDLDI